MSSINGLKRISATSINNSGVFRLGNNYNSGEAGQVIISQGDEQPAVWGINHGATPNALSMGTNINLTSGATSWDGSIADVINVPPFYDTTYDEGKGIEIDYIGPPVPVEPIISVRTDDFTINAIASGSNPKNLNVLRVPKELKPGTNITYSPPSATGFNGSADVIINATDTKTPNELQQGANIVMTNSLGVNVAEFDGSEVVSISATDTNTEYTGGLGIEITAFDAINARTDGYTTAINGPNNTIEVLRVPNQLRSGTNIQMTNSAGLIQTNYDGDQEIIISSTAGIEYSGGDGIIVDDGDEEISASLDSINNTLGFNSNDEIEVLKVPNELQQGANIVMTNSLGVNVAEFDGSEVVSIKLEESPIIQDLTITGGTGFNHIETMSIAVGNATTIISGLNINLFTNGITGGFSPTQLQGVSPGGFVASGGGTTSTNGFNSLLSPEPTARYFVFSGGTQNTNRWIRTKNIQTLIIQGGTIEAYFIQGNSSNGGENADTNENLVFEVLDAGFFVIGSPVVVSLGATGYIGNLFTLFSYTLSLPQRSQGYYLQFRQTAHSGFAFDNYGIKYIRFNSGESDVRILNLPTFAPPETGRLWNNSGVLNIVP